MDSLSVLHAESLKR